MTTTYPVINGVTCVPELRVAFRTYNKADSQTYRGRILGCVNYDIAANYGDVLAIHNDMEASVARKDVAVETFLIVETADGARRPFAVSWINATSFKATDTASDATLVLHNITESDLYKVMTTIRDLGFDVTLK